MNLIRLSVKKPVAVAMFSLIILLTGLFSMLKLPLELTPDVDFPRLSITTYWPDSSPEMIEAFVTSPLEGAINTVSHIHKIKSTSEQGQSLIEVEFVRGTDMNFAAMNLNEKISLVREDLPYGAYEPQISKYVPKAFQTNRFFSLRLTGNYSLQELRRIGLERISPALMGIEGVTHVDVIGGQDRVIEVIADQKAIKLYNITLEQIRSKLLQMGYRQSVGVIYKGSTRIDLMVDTPIDRISQIEDAVLLKRGAALIRIRDVALVRDTYGRPRNISRINGFPAIVVNVEREAGSNIVEVINRIEQKLKDLEKKLPQGLTMIVDNDQSLPIRNNLRSLGERALFSIFVIFIVLYIFIRSFKVPLIIISTIFFSTLLTITLFFIFHISLNLLTLAGLALGFGMLVDNAIVVVENVFRHQRLGQNIREASARGTEEVMMPIIASTLTTVAAFIPFLYLTGELRIYYLPFTMAVGFSLLSSLAVAFLVTPSLIARFPTFPEMQDKEHHDKTFLSMYQQFLSVIIRHRIITLTAAAVLLASGIYVFDKYVIKGKIFEWRNQSTLSVYVSMPKGAQLKRADTLIKVFEDVALKAPYAGKISTTVSPEYAYMRITFPKSVRNSTYPYLLKEQLISKASLVAGAGVSISGFGEGYYNGSGMSYSSNYRIKILGYNYNKLDMIAKDIGSRLKHYVRVKNINTNLSREYYLGSGTEMILKVKRERLDRFNITMDFFLYHLQAYLRESLAWQRIRFNGTEVDYLLKFEGFNSFSIRELMKSTITSPKGEQVRINQVAELENRKIMPEIVRENQQYMRLVGFEYRGPYKMGDKLLETIIKTTQVPPGFKLERDSYWFFTKEEQKQISLVLIVSLFLVFLVTAGLFESILHPFLILLTVPLSLVGVFFIFYLANSPFDRSAYIGVVLLGGIVVNDSILLVDHINFLRRRGENLFNAVILGARDRVRPILMTTFTTIGGLLPLVFMVKDKSDIWYSLALATIGGLLSSTLMVLTVIPALYVIFERVKLRYRKFLNSI
ncbi:efflux RND transporter permease subunit [bacterium]|nr:efflux RND transporter permease subunit [bacterium]